MVANPQQFPSPVPTAAALLSLINALQSAQSGVDSRTKGASTLRNNAADALIIALQQLLSYVQSLADASPDTGSVIIAAAGLQIRSVPTRAQALLTLTNGKPSGTVNVRASAALLKQISNSSSHAVVFSWQVSSDDKNWTNLPVRAVASTTITGLTPMTAVWVRVAVTVGKQPMGDWSPAATIVVH